MAKAPPPPPGGVAKAAADFFSLPELSFPEFPASLKGYGQVAGAIWASAPVMLNYYAKSIGEIWSAYTETYIKRFEALSPADKNKLMNSGLEGALLFLLLTMISRYIMNKFIDPFLNGAFHYPKYMNNRRGKSYDNPHAGGLAYDKMKAAFTASVLGTIWHANTHVFYNFGIPFDLAVFFMTCASLSFTVYRRTQSLSAVGAFFVIPFIVLLPVSVTVGFMQFGPYFKDLKMFPSLVAAVTVITALYIVLEAPSIPILMTLSAKGIPRTLPYWDALGQEISQLWVGGLFGSKALPEPAKGRTGRRNTRRAGQGGRQAGRSRAKRQNDDYNEMPKEPSNLSIGGLLSQMKGVFGSSYNAFEGSIMLVVSLIYRIIKLIRHITGSFGDTLLVGMKSLPGMSKFVADSMDEDQGRARGRSVQPARGQSRSRSRTPKLSRRVSRARG